MCQHLSHKGNATMLHGGALAVSSVRAGLRVGSVARMLTRARCTSMPLDASVPGLDIEVTRGVATLRLTNARRRNPLTRPILGKMREWLSARANDWPVRNPSDDTPLAAVRVIVLESSGPIWSSGHDFKDFHGASDVAARDVLNLCSEVNMLLSAVPQVTIAAVTGGCIAGGAQLAASCDLVLAQAESASFLLPGASGGGFCHTPAVAIAARVSARHAFELAALAEPIDAEEAHRIGLVNRVICEAEWRQRVDAIAQCLADRFNHNQAEGKRVFRQQATAPSLDAKYALATDAMVDMFGSVVWQGHMGGFLDRRNLKPGV